LGRAILQLTAFKSGYVQFDNVELTRLGSRSLRRMRRRMQLIFQDPFASLNPRRRIGDIVAEPLRIAGVASHSTRGRRVRDALSAVGLEPEQVLGRLPHEFSGGQCQRICIARALVIEPELLVCDEAVAALDVSIRAQIINLLEAMKARYRLTLLFIAHDLAVVKAISDRVAVMYLGRLCEVSPTEALYRNPAHPYTKLLLEATQSPTRMSSHRAACLSGSRLRRWRHLRGAASARGANAPTGAVQKWCRSSAKLRVAAGSPATTR
jgi:peptide/nickel transport system ATP-binding protein